VDFFSDMHSKMSKKEKQCEKASGKDKKRQECNEKYGKMSKKKENERKPKNNNEKGFSFGIARKDVKKLETMTKGQKVRQNS
jgi:hypothetical protein